MAAPHSEFYPTGTQFSPPGGPIENRRQAESLPYSSLRAAREFSGLVVQIPYG
jgi:hypothetical protein